MPTLNETRMVPVKNCDAAGMFAMNLKVWKDTEFIRENYRPEEIEDLERELTVIVTSGSKKREIEWTMRQRAWRTE